MLKFKEWESPQKFKESLADFINDVGVSTEANAILRNDALKLESSKILFQETHVEFKKSVKKSIITSKKKKAREYFLSLTLCEELYEKVLIKCHSLALILTLISIKTSGWLVAKMVLSVFLLRSIIPTFSVQNQAKFSIT